jgi:hypothetical protein
MKALKSYNGSPGEGVQQPDGTWYIDAGSEFFCATEPRANEMERAGLAVPLPASKLDEIRADKMAPLPVNKMEPAPQNKAATSGPLASAGGETGAASAPSSSDQVRQPRRQTSKRSAGALDL